MRTDDSLAAARLALTIDPDRSNVVLCVGTKGSGKSQAARLLFDSYPYDRVVVDVNGDARPDDPLTRPMVAPFGHAMPEPDVDADPPEHRVTVWARVDPRSSTYVDDQDDALNLALFPRHRKVCAWIDEYAELATAAKIPPNTKKLLHSSRHHNATLLLCCPRPRFIPTLTISQADKVLIFDTPNPKDREVLADNMGYPWREFEQAYQQTMAGPDHSFLLWDKHQKHLFAFPPLPITKTHGPRR